MLNGLPNDGAQFQEFLNLIAGLVALAPGLGKFLQMNRRCSRGR